MKGKVGFILAFCFWVYNPVFVAKRRILGLRRDIFKKGIILFGALLFLKNIEARKTRVLTTRLLLHIYIRQSTYYQIRSALHQWDWPKGKRSD